ncbi:MAG: AAA family ATPase, partial [bacterium]|nr:AAA family ATPase [bacterium]
NILFKTRRAISVALAVSDLFAKQTGLDALRQRNASSMLEGEKAELFRALTEAGSYVAAFSAAAYLKQMVEAGSETASDVEPPDWNFDTPLDGLKTLVAGLETVVEDARDDAVLAARVRAFCDEALEDLLSRKNRFSGLGEFEQTHLRLDSDGFELNGFDVAPGTKSKPLVMTFKKPNEIIGNHIAKYQAMKLAKMLMAYDFDRQMNPFVEMGGFLFTFIGDGAPGTGKTILIQMIA